MVLDGPMTRDWFLAYVAQVLDVVTSVLPAPVAYWSARGAAEAGLARPFAGSDAEADAAYGAAIAGTGNAAERAFLEDRRRSLHRA